jgi:hypothetical protein
MVFSATSRGGDQVRSIFSMRNHRQRTVIIAMIAVRMMQPSADEIIDVVTVWNSLVTTVGAMPMC